MSHRADHGQRHWAPACSAGLDVLNLSCAPGDTLDGHPVLTIASQARAGSATVTIMARIQVSVDGTGASLLRVERI